MWLSTAMAFSPWACLVTTKATPGRVICTSIPQGRLINSDGLPILGDGGPIALPPFEKIYVGSDGSITVQPEGQGPETQVQVGRLKLVNPEFDALVKDPNGLLRRRDGAEQPADPDVTVVSGFLESSNVNAVGEMTQILALARQYEIEVRMMRTAEETTVPHRSCCASADALTAQY